MSDNKLLCLTFSARQFRRPLFRNPFSRKYLHYMAYDFALLLNQSFAALRFLLEPLASVDKLSDH
jgi:hypothetical protein